MKSIFLTIKLSHNSITAAYAFKIWKQAEEKARYLNPYLGSMEWDEVECYAGGKLVSA